VNLATHPNLAPRIKGEWSHISPPPYAVGGGKRTSPLFQTELVENTTANMHRKMSVNQISNMAYFKYKHKSTGNKNK